MTNVELLAKRANIFEQMKAINAAATKENRNLNSEEQVSFDKANADIVELNAQIKRNETLDVMERELTQTRGSLVDPLKGKSATILSPDDPQAQELYRSAWIQHVRSGFLDNRMFRDLNTTTPADGGYTVPVVILNKIKTELQRLSFVRKAGASVISTNVRTSIPFSNVPTLTWEAEKGSYGGGSDADPTIGTFPAQPRKITGVQTISEELLFDSAVNIEAYVSDLFSKGAALAFENAYVNGAGSGSNQPKGFVADATATAVASTSTVTGPEIKAAFYALPAQYRMSPSCAWFASDKFIGLAAGLFLNQIQQDFKYATAPGEPDTLFGKPIYSSGAITETWTNDALVATVLDVSQYQIVDFNAYTAIIRLAEQSAITGQIKVLGRFATDGKLLFPDAGRTIKLAHS